MTKTTQHVRLDLQKARNLGIEVIQSDGRFLELAWEGREVDMESIDTVLIDAQFDRAEIAQVLDTIYEITQMKMLRKLIG